MNSRKLIILTYFRYLSEYSMFYYTSNSVKILVVALEIRAVDE